MITKQIFFLNNIYLKITQSLIAKKNILFLFKNLKISITKKDYIDVKIYYYFYYIKNFAYNYLTFAFYLFLLIN